MTPLGSRLRQLRKRTGDSVRAFAERIRKSPGYVSQIEARGEIPTPELLCRIAEIHGIEPEELLKLAKIQQLRKAEGEIEAKHTAALELHRKARQ